ncbi:MAG: hypothetical protein ACI9VL_000766, partial [Colwellia sp.]
LPKVNSMDCCGALNSTGLLFVKDRSPLLLASRYFHKLLQIIV